jgi:hypothetical protein
LSVHQEEKTELSLSGALLFLILRSTHFPFMNGYMRKAEEPPFLKRLFAGKGRPLIPIFSCAFAGVRQPATSTLMSPAVGLFSIGDTWRALVGLDPALHHGAAQ